jgi:hypothetical protein
MAHCCLSDVFPTPLGATITTIFVRGQADLRSNLIIVPSRPTHRSPVAGKRLAATCMLVGIGVYAGVEGPATVSAKDGDGATKGGFLGQSLTSALRVIVIPGFAQPLITLLASAMEDSPLAGMPV